MPLDLERPTLRALTHPPRAKSNSTSVDRKINVLAYVHLRNIHASTGAGRVARQLTEHLALRKDVSLRLLADKADYARVMPLVGEPWQSLRSTTFTSDTSRQQARWLMLDSPKAESYWPDADIVFCTGESYVPAKKARLVVTAHDAAYFEQGAHQSGSAVWRQRLKWKILFNKLAARADMIHTVSQYSADRLSHFFPALAGRIRVVPNAVTPHFFEPVSGAGMQYLSDHALQYRPFILIPGGLSFRKNAELILAAAPRLLAMYPDLSVVVSGHNDAAYVARLQQTGCHLQLLGFIEDSALHALYSKAIAVWFPSQYEGFGMPVLEAMASGTPVVASDCSSIPEIAGAEALLAAPHDAAMHLERLSALISDAGLRARMAVQGRARAARYTWSDSAGTLAMYFRELL